MGSGLVQVNINVEVPERLKKFLANPTPYISGVMKAADKESLILVQRDIADAAPRKKGKLAKSSSSIEREVTAIIG